MDLWYFIVTTPIRDLPGRNLPQQTGPEASLQPVRLTNQNRLDPPSRKCLLHCAVWLESRSIWVSTTVSLPYPRPQSLPVLLLFLTVCAFSASWHFPSQSITIVMPLVSWRIAFTSFFEKNKTKHIHTHSSRPSIVCEDRHAWEPKWRNILSKKIVFHSFLQLVAFSCLLLDERSKHVTY